MSNGKNNGPMSKELARAEFVGVKECNKTQRSVRSEILDLERRFNEKVNTLTDNLNRAVTLQEQMILERNTEAEAEAMSKTQERTEIRKEQRRDMMLFGGAVAVTVAVIQILPFIWPN